MSLQIYDAKVVPRYTVFGNYMEAIYLCPESCTNVDVNGPNVRLVWKGLGINSWLQQRAKSGRLAEKAISRTSALMTRLPSSRLR
jgi:hypothetical protein